MKLQFDLEIITCDPSNYTMGHSKFIWKTHLVHEGLCLYKIWPQHEISNNVVCVSSKASDQPAHTRSLIRALASRLNIL